MQVSITYDIEKEEAICLGSGFEGNIVIAIKPKLDISKIEYDNQIEYLLLEDVI